MPRKFVSFTVFFAFIVLMLTTIVLYFIPGGGAAGPWSFMGLHRGQWTDLHLTSGWLFLSFGLWHAVINRRGIVSGLKKIASVSLKASWPVLAALALNAFVVTGTINNCQPTAQILSIYSSTKQKLRQSTTKAAPESETGGLEILK